MVSQKHESVVLSQTSSLLGRADQPFRQLPVPRFPLVSDLENFLALAYIRIPLSIKLLHCFSITSPRRGNTLPRFAAVEELDGLSVHVFL